jgi:VanZ family protein
VKRYRWLIWAGFLLGWTYLLTFPVPEPLLETTETIVPSRRFYVAKTVHITGYLLLTVLTGWLAAPQRYRPLLMLFVMGHCVGTELIQEAFAHRTGSLLDVGLDQIGVLAGFLLSWKWWTEAPPG